MRQHHQTRAGAARPALDRHGVPLLAGVPPRGARIAVLASTFNGAIVDRLADGALDALREAGMAPTCCLCRSRAPGNCHSWPRGWPPPGAATRSSLSAA
jgi:hypothetical protein